MVECVTVGCISGTGDAPRVRLIKVLRPEDGILEASQRKPKKCLAGEVRSKPRVSRMGCDCCVPFRIGPQP